MPHGSSRGYDCARRARSAPELEGHVIITEYDAVATGLVDRLDAAGIPYFIVEPDAAKATRFVSEDLSVVAGENDSRATYERLLTRTRGSSSPTVRTRPTTNITLTVREVAARF